MSDGATRGGGQQPWKGGDRAGRPRFLDQVRAAMRARHYGRRTEEAYVHWVRRFILYHGKRHPAEMAEDGVNAFLTHLAVDRCVAASTQNQALAALLFVYGKGRKNRVTMLPAVAAEPLAVHFRNVRRQHQGDLGKGLGRAPLPHALSWFER